MLLTRVTAPAMPVRMFEIMDQLRQPSDDAIYIEAIRATAHDMVTEMSGRTLGAETWDMALARVSRDVILPKSPVQSLVSVSYYDAAGAVQTATLSDFALFKDTDIAIVRPKADKAWPGLQVREDAITFRFVAGYTTPPDALQFAVRLCAEAIFDRNLADLKPVIDALIDIHRLGWVGS